MILAGDIELEFELKQFSHNTQSVCAIVQLRLIVVMYCTPSCGLYWCSSWICRVANIYVDCIVLYDAIPFWLTSIDGHSFSCDLHGNVMLWKGFLQYALLVLCPMWLVVLVVVVVVCVVCVCVSVCECVCVCVWGGIYRWPWPIHYVPVMEDNLQIT